MPLDLPPCIARYLAWENAPETGTLTDCFAADAVVRDEGREMTGLDAITAWKTASREKYQHSIEPLESATRDGKVVVTGKVTGNFPGSPVNLHFAFTLRGDRIAALEIQ
ncbi:MAG TPA: nuclear transport factor 2 family protein [Dongiaceae bacterium]|nr:nuclear transport factor 2 family protein [Dongiaceae bacterium]